MPCTVRIVSAVCLVLYHLLLFIGMCVLCLLFVLYAMRVHYALGVAHASLQLCKSLNQSVCAYACDCALMPVCIFAIPVCLSCLPSPILPNNPCPSPVMACPALGHVVMRPSCPAGMYVCMALLPVSQFVCVYVCMCVYMQQYMYACMQ